jgi:dCTP deaminase
MILGRAEIIDLWKRKKIRFNPDISENQIGICSVDIRLGYVVSKLKQIDGVTITPSLSRSAEFFEGRTVKPGECICVGGHEFILTTTLENIFLPYNVAAMVEGRSTYARWGLSAHVTAPLIEPGFFGPITLEMYNHGHYGINLRAGHDTVCQLIFYKTTSSVNSKIVENLGRYRGQTSPEPKPYEKK